MADTQPSTESQGTPGSQGAQSPSLKTYITTDMVATTLFSMRMATILCTLLFIPSTLGLSLVASGHTLYLNAMLTAFFTFTIRLNQRKKQAEISLFSQAMFNLLSTEDSGHYMLYTFFYYNQLPLTIYLIPVFLYAVLFSVSYTQGLIPFLSGSIQRFLTNMNARIAAVQQDIKRFIAYTEVFIMFIVIWNTLTGYMFILAPLMHYQFLRLRYCSKRNPYTRIVFSDLRMTLEHLAAHPRCPTAVSSLIRKTIQLISRLAPVERMQREA